MIRLLPTNRSDYISRWRPGLAKFAPGVAEGEVFSAAMEGMVCFDVDGNRRLDFGEFARMILAYVKAGGVSCSASIFSLRQMYCHHWLHLSLRCMLSDAIICFTGFVFDEVADFLVRLAEQSVQPGANGSSSAAQPGLE